MLRETFQDLNRLRQIASVVARHGFGAYIERSRLRELLRREPGGGTADGTATGGVSPPEKPEPGRKTAARFRQLLIDLGPTFVKFGQILSSRPDILPSYWIEELSQLQDACAPVGIEEIRAQIERGLGRPVEDLFVDLVEAPLASASIAQVHRALTKDGQPVAIKVQRPRIREGIEADLDLLHYLAQLLEAIIEETGIYTPIGIVEEFDRAIHEELDFANEAQNIRAMAQASKGRDYLVIPGVHDALSSSAVLTLDYVDGVKVSDITSEAGFDLEQVAKNIIEAAFHQLFDDGIFHGDPHPGNILVLPGNRIGLLDFGLVGRLSHAMQDALVTLIVAMALQDPDSIARVLYRIGVPEGHVPLTKFRSDISALLDRYLGLRLDQIRATTVLRDLLDLAIRHKIKIPKEYALLGKSAIAVEGLIRRLYPSLDILAVGLPYAKRMLMARFTPGDASGRLMKSLLKIQTLADDLPAQLSQILMDLEGGKLRVNVHSEQIERVSASIRGLETTVLLGISSAGLLVGGLIVLSRVLAGSTALTVLGIGALVFALGLSGTAFAIHLAGNVKKISIRKRLSKH